MLTLRLTPYASKRWIWKGTAYATDDQTSQVAPFRHPMIENLAVTDGDRTLLVVRERAVNRPDCPPGPRLLGAAEYDEVVALVSQWPLDYVHVETAAGRPVRISAGAARTTPLYLAHRSGVLHGSWDMADLRGFATGLSSREAARLLIYRPRYGTETLFTGVHRLTERATAVFGGDLHIRYPEPALHSDPRDVVSDHGVLPALTEAIDAALDRQPLDPDTAVFHLTGGLDSGTLATYAAARRWPGRLNTAALLVTGAGREQQLRRRKQLRAQIPFGPHDVITDCRDRPPLHPDCARRRGDLVSPYEEPLHLPFTDLITRLAELGAQTVVTGLGGDEMVALSPEESAAVAAANAHITEKLPWLGPNARFALEYSEDGIAPPALVNSISLLSLETTAPPLLRAGIWPVHPFTAPAMVQTGRFAGHDGPACGTDTSRTPRHAPA